MHYAPVAVFVYKRIEKTRQVLEALNNNTLANRTDMYIFCDGAKTENDLAGVEGVHCIARKFKETSSFQSVQIIESKQNKGLANSIISGVAEVIKEYGKIIVVEDDLLTCNTFLEYMNEGLEFFENNMHIGSISGYSFSLPELDDFETDIYALRKGECWGWATWENRWNKVDWEVRDYISFKKNRRLRKEFDSTQYGISKMLDNQMQGKIDSWAVRWNYHLLKENQLTIYPKVSKTYNIGFDGDGTNCTVNSLYDANFKLNQPKCRFCEVSIDKKIESKVAKFEKDPIKVLLKTIIKKYLFRGHEKYEKI